MSIFAYEEKPYHEDQPAYVSKAEKFRLEIRKRQQSEKFSAIRKQFIESLNQLSFLQELKNEKDNLNLQKIQWLISGLKQGMNVASFYQTISDMNLQPYLCQLVLNREISLENRCKILHSLVQLLYFGAKIPQDFIESNIIDSLRIELIEMNVAKDEVQQKFLQQISMLVLNLTRFKNESFNLHMIDSDFLSTLQGVLEKTEEKYRDEDNKIQEIRINILMIYCNIFLSRVGTMKFVSFTIQRIVIDDRNLRSEELLCRVLNCLVAAAQVPQFWRYQQKYLFSKQDKINERIANIIDLIKKNFHPFAFGLLIDFFNELLGQNDSSLDEQVFYLIFVNDRDFLLSCIRKLEQNEQLRVCKRSMCKAVKLISRLEKLQGVVYTTVLERDFILHAIMKTYVVHNKNFVKYLLRILIRMLEENKVLIDQLINHGITSTIRDALSQTQYLQQEELILLIDLVQKMIQAEEELRDKSQGGDGVNKMLAAFESKGFIRDIEKLQDHEIKEVFRRSESFMAKIAQISQQRR